MISIGLGPGEDAGWMRATFDLSRLLARESSVWWGHVRLPVSPPLSTEITDMQAGVKPYKISNGRSNVEVITTADFALHQR